jgi:hypothetical protein
VDTERVRRFWSKVDKNGPIPDHRPDLGPCWVWTKGCSTRGYGVFAVAIGKQNLSHRVSYELLVGPIPDGLTLDHLCHNGSTVCVGKECEHRRCVNPAHLEPVTRAENVMRGLGITATNARKTLCPRGHPYDLISSGKRRCLRCKRERYHERKAAQ